MHIFTFTFTFNFTFTFVCCLRLLCIIIPVVANVEKTIFLAPSFIPSTTNFRYLDELNLDELSPVKRSIRRQIPAIFPNTTNPRGSETWFLLKGLEEQQKYEVRICWAATQPTSFTLDTYDLEEVFSTPILLQALVVSSELRQPVFKELDKTNINPKASLNTFSASTPVRSTTLLLRILAAADYFTTNSSLMQNVPLVNVDIILDPFLFNILPGSLLPTAVYITIIAIGAWFLSDFIWLYLHQISLSGKTPISSDNPKIKTAPAKKDI